MPITYVSIISLLTAAVTIRSIIHSLRPIHLVSGFEFFSDAFFSEFFTILEKREYICI